MSIVGIGGPNESNLNHLLNVWNRHQDLRRTGSTVAELSASRIELDRARELLR